MLKRMFAGMYGRVAVVLTSVFVFLMTLPSRVHADGPLAASLTGCLGGCNTETGCVFYALFCGHYGLMWISQSLIW